MSELQQIKYIQCQIFLNAIDRVVTIHDLSEPCITELKKKRDEISKKVKRIYASIIPLFLILTIQAVASDLDTAQQQLEDRSSGDYTVSRRDIPKFTDEDIENIKETREQLRNFLAKSEGK